MQDAGFIAAAYAIILGGLGLYTVTLWRRLRAARSAHREGDGARDAEG